MSVSVFMHIFTNMYMRTHVHMFVRVGAYTCMYVFMCGGSNSSTHARALQSET